MRQLSLPALALLALSVAACAEPEASSSNPSEPVKRDFRGFQDGAYPVLLRDCGFAACHGEANRFFRVWGPGRERLPDDQGLPGAFDVPGSEEITTSFVMARTMIDADNPAQSPLLRKPLAVAAGGSGHLGVDKFGRDIYRTKQDHGYQMLLGWVMEEQEQMQEPTPSP